MQKIKFTFKVKFTKPDSLNICFHEYFFVQTLDPTYSRLKLIHTLPFSISTSDILYLYLRYSVSLPPIFCISTSDILYLYLRYSVSLPPIFCNSTSDILYLYLRYSVSLPPIFCISTSDTLYLCPLMLYTQ